MSICVYVNEIDVTRFFILKEHTLIVLVLCCIYFYMKNDNNLKPSYVVILSSGSILVYLFIYLCCVRCQMCGTFSMPMTWMSDEIHARCNFSNKKVETKACKLNKFVICSSISKILSAKIALNPFLFSLSVQHDICSIRSSELDQYSW
jgi:hypothetical protein